MSAEPETKVILYRQVSRSDKYHEDSVQYRPIDILLAYEMSCKEDNSEYRTGRAS